MAGILGAAPFGTPYILPSGVVGFPYTSGDLSSGKSAGGVPPWTLTAPEVPLTYSLSAGALPGGLAFDFPSPLAAVVVPPDAAGVNIIKAVGTPTTPGVFDFTINWRSAEFPAFGNEVSVSYRITIGAPNAADLKYFDHADFPPTEINTPSDFNNDLLGLWLGYDAVNKLICITNSHRSVVLYCMQIVPGVIDPRTLIYFDHSDTSPTKINSATPFNDPKSDVWIGWDAAACKMCITNYNRTILLGCADLSPTGGGTLIFFDNANALPANQMIAVPFNNEFGNVWMGWDDANKQLCVTNYNRTTKICCFTLLAPVAPPVP
jgi:hypothetical protein